MGKGRRILSMFAVMVMCGLFFESCGYVKEGTAQENTITVWSHLSDAEIESVKELAQKWGKDNSVEVNVVQGKGSRQESVKEIEGDSGLDIIYGIQHDLIGTFVKDNVADEVPYDMVKTDDYISKKVTDAVTIDGKIYGLPLSEETSALYYNKDKINRVPDTMEDLEKMSVKYHTGFQFDITDLYKCYGFIGTYGGYIFKDNNGVFDKNDFGLNNEGAVNGYKFLKKLVTEDKLMPEDIEGDKAEKNFENGDNAFYISGPEDIAKFKANNPNLDFGVAPIPSFQGQTVPGLLCVEIGLVKSSSHNKDLSWKLLKYLNDNAAEVVTEKGKRIPVTKDEFNSFKDKEFIKGFTAQAENAVLTPNIPEMQSVWDLEKEQIKLLISDEIDEETAGEYTVNDVRKSIE